MTMHPTYKADPTRDLVITRTIDVPVSLVWKAWTVPEHIIQWFTPKPWSTVSADVDLRPGGRCITTMRSPEGELFPNAGCYLEIVPERRLVFTSAMHEGFRPVAPPPGMWHFTGIISMEPVDANRTKYTATAIHGDPDSAAKHEAMGFSAGWGTALNQLVEWATEFNRRR
jgi:uncharacterized protein YndB with AHSA1/START domain